MNSYRLTKLNNGIMVVSENLPYVRSFSLGFWFNTGSTNETASNNGISHFIEHMLFKGTEHRTAKKIADDIESLGGYLNAFTSKEHTCYYGRGLSQHLPKTFEVLADMVQYSVFKERDIKKEAGVIIDELNDIEDSPEELIFDKFESNIYNGASLQYPIIGAAENIENFTSAEIIGYLNKFYSFNNLYIVASGAVEHDMIVDLTNKFLTKNMGLRFKRKIKIKLLSAKDLFVEKDIQQTHVILGKPTYGISNKKRIAVSLLSHIIGEGSSSRLFQALRERNGITYQVNSFLNSFYDVSSFGIYFSTNPKLASKAMNIIYIELQKLLNKPVSAKELKRAKEYIKGSVVMSLESTTNRMLRIAQSVIYFNKIKSVEQTMAEIENVTIDELFELGKTILDPGDFVKTIISSDDRLIKSAS